MPKKRKRKVSKNGKQNYSTGWNPDVKFNVNIEPETLYEIIAIILIVIAGITILSIFHLASKLGVIWLHFLKVSIGWTVMFLPLILIGLAVILFYHQKYKVKPKNAD